MQTNFRPVQTFCRDPYFCKKEESCKFLFAHILSNDALYAYRIPLVSFESWDFGPKIGLDGLDGLAQVWTPLPPDVASRCIQCAAAHRCGPAMEILEGCSGLQRAGGR